MLVQLAIRDIVLIERLDIGFAAGLSVLTGETGAGKSILLDAFALALGGRGDGALVRHGEAKGQVTAVFDVAAAHPARALAQRTTSPTTATSSCGACSSPTGARAPSSTTSRSACRCSAPSARTLVEIHGQHDDRALVDASRAPGSARRLRRLRRRPSPRRTAAAGGAAGAGRAPRADRAARQARRISSPMPSRSSRSSRRRRRGGRACCQPPADDAGREGRWRDQRGV